MTRIRAVIFDMDGVLLEAKEWHYEALNRALAHYGHIITRQEHLTTYDGLSTRRKLEMLTREHDLPAAFHERINELKQQYTLELIESLCEPLPIHEFALATLKSEGYIVGLASNSIRQTVDVAMERANLARYFDFTLSNQDVGKPKPHPEIYLAAMERAGTAPSECVIVEDNHHGVEAATLAGGHVCRVGSVYDVTYNRIRGFIDAIEIPAEVAVDRMKERKAA
jgi:beta-phosphoglucomutase